MRFYNQSHNYFCGIDLHARTMYLCIVDSSGQIVLHQNMKCRAELLLEAIAPYRDNLVIGVECIFTWYWIADLCQREGIAFALGHALYMKAIHGGKAKNDKIDSEKIARMLRGGLFPLAYAYPAEKRATRDLLRRRMHLMRFRSELSAHVHNTAHQYNLPTLTLRVDRASQRRQIPAPFPDADVRQMVQLDIDLIDTLDTQLKALEQDLALKAKAHDAGAYHRVRSVRGIGRILTRVIVYEIDDIHRFPGVSQFVSYARLIKCAQESAGKRLGHSGNKIGNAYLKWAFSEAAVLFLRNNPPAQQAIEKLARRHGKAKALSILAHKLGRCVFTMLKKGQPFDEARFMRTLAH